MRCILIILFLASGAFAQNHDEIKLLFSSADSKRPDSVYVLFSLDNIVLKYALDNNIVTQEELQRHLIELQDKGDEKASFLLWKNQFYSKNEEEKVLRKGKNDGSLECCSLLIIGNLFFSKFSEIKDVDIDHFRSLVSHYNEKINDEDPFSSKILKSDIDELLTKKPVQELHPFFKGLHTLFKDRCDLPD